MHLSPDEIIFWQHGFLKLNATIAFTWGLMFVLVVGSTLVTRKLSTGLQRSRWQNLLEIVVTAINQANRRGRPASAGEISGLSGNVVPVCRDGERLHHRSRL